MAETRERKIDLAMAGARPPAYCSIATVAREIEKSESWVREELSAGRFPRPLRKLGREPRWDWRDIEHWMETGEVRRKPETPEERMVEKARGG